MYINCDKQQRGSDAPAALITSLPLPACAFFVVLEPHYYCCWLKGFIFYIKSEHNSYGSTRRKIVDKNIINHWLWISYKTIKHKYSFFQNATFVKQDNELNESQYNVKWSSFNLSKSIFVTFLSYEKYPLNSASTSVV